MTPGKHADGGSPACDRSGSRPRRATVVLVVFVAVWLLAGSTLAASEDRVRPDDPMFQDGDQWALENTGQMINWTSGTPGADIDATRAWSITTGSRDVVVAILDNDFDYRAEDLAANAWTNPGGVNGCPAGSHGYDGPTGECEPDTTTGHGTSMGWIIGAVSDNGQGMAGVNWTASLMGVTHQSEKTDAMFIELVDWIVGARQAGVNVRVINVSSGWLSDSQEVRDAIVRAGQHGILLVAAAGNAGEDRDVEPVYPCVFDLSNVICVAASDQDDELAPGSAYGANTVHLAAPGRHICGTPYSSCSGVTSTSDAAAFVSGVAALVWSYDPGLSMRQVRSAILDNVDRLESLEGKVITGGRINAYRALLAVSSASSPTPSPEPTSSPSPSPTPSPSPSPTSSPSPSASKSPAESESPSSSPSTSGSTSSQPSGDTSPSPGTWSHDGADPHPQSGVDGPPEQSDDSAAPAGGASGGDAGTSGTSNSRREASPSDAGAGGGRPPGPSSPTGPVQIDLGADGTGPSQPDTTGTPPTSGQHLSDTTPQPRTAAGSQDADGGWAWAVVVAGLAAGAVLGARRIGL